MGKNSTKGLDRERNSYAAALLRRCAQTTRNAKRYRGEMGLRRSSVLHEKAMLLGKRRLLHFPSVARAKKLGEVAATALGDYVFDLLVHHVFVAWHVAPRAENSDGRWEVRALLHVR